jgi:guanylate kinase
MIIVLTGKSGVGKDAIQSKLVEEYEFERIVTATTRPKRVGEVEGRDYYFLDKKTFEKRIGECGFIEYRKYDTLVDGKPDTWYYGTPKQELDTSKDYVIILDKKGAQDFIYYYGMSECLWVYVDVSDDIRLQRAMSRGSFDKSEWGRRFKDDAEKFKDMKYYADTVVVNDGKLEDVTDKIVTEYSNRIADKRYEEFVRNDIYEDDFENDQLG